jgi:hypothetical protein
VVYHWANGLWTAAITWGLTISVAAQRRWGLVCAAMGVVLAVFSAGAIYKARTYPVSDQERAAIRAYMQDANAPQRAPRHAEPGAAPAAMAAPAGVVR